MDFSRDGKSLTVVSTNLASLDAATGHEKRFPLHESVYFTSRFFPLHKMIDKPVLTALAIRIDCGAFSSDGGMLATGGGRVVGGDGFPTYPNAMLWDVDRTECLGEIIPEERTGKGGAATFALSADGKLLALGYTSGQITVWRLKGR